MNGIFKVVLITFIVFWILFAPTSLIIPDSTFNGWVKNGLTLMLIVLLFKDLKHFFDKEYRYFNICIILYCLCTILSVIVNASAIEFYSVSTYLLGQEMEVNGISSPKNAIYASISLLMFALFLQRSIATGKSMQVIKILVVLFGLVLVPTDIDAMLRNVVNDSAEIYIVGNKFGVCYMNLYFCTLLFTLLAGKKRPVYHCAKTFSVLVLLAVSIHTKCSTMVAGAFVFFLLNYLSSRRLLNAMSKPNVMLLTLFVCDILFFFFTSWALQFDVVQYIVVDVLHEDLTLTGRLGIYADIQKAFAESPWLGFGEGNSGVISLYYTQAWDAQNGLVDMFIQIGVIGVAAFVGLLYVSFLKANKSKNKKYVYPVLSMVYTMIAVSMVEIPFKRSFVFFLCLLFLCDNKIRLKASNIVLNIEKYSKDDLNI